MSTTSFPEKLFCVCTVVNDLQQYDQMRQSFLEAGFTENHCRFVLFDNSAQNLFEPYSSINRTLDEASEPYVIACHQDVLLDQECGFHDLVGEIQKLDRLSPQWAVAGNSGGRSNLTEIYHLHDPNGYHRASLLPQQVQTLDENFLLIRVASGVRCSEELSGFHLYAADLCLNAAQHGLPSYVIDSYLSHHGGGNAGSEGFHTSKHEFQRHWDKPFRFCFIRTPSSLFYLSRYGTVRRLLAFPPLMKLARGAYKLARVVQSVSEVWSVSEV